jgi:hypothetical protein
MAKWKVMLYAADAVVALICLALLAKFFSNYKKRMAGTMD